MDKIPVGRTISDAYSFAFRGFFRILSIMWVPFLLIGLLIVLVGAANPGIFAARFHPKSSATLSDLAILIPLYLIAIVLLLVQAVGVTKEALGLRSGSRYFYLSLDRQLWLFIAALLLTTLLLAAAIFVVSFGIGIIGITVAATGAHASTTPDAKLGITIAASIAFIVVFCALTYVVVRQLFLLAPVVIAEKKLGLKRSWQLGENNFWRMFAIYLSTLVPIFATEFAAIFVVVKTLGAPPDRRHGATLEQIAAWNAHFVSFLAAYKFLIIALFIVFITLAYGLVYGAQAFAYRARICPDEAEDVL